MDAPMGVKIGMQQSVCGLTIDISGRQRAQPFDCPLDGRVRALFGEVHGGAHFGSFCERKHTLPNVPPARQTARANPAKATDVSHFASFLAFPQCQDRLEGRHSLP